jgi:hypothetical protein
MKTFTRKKSTSPPMADRSIDFAADSEKIAVELPPDYYDLRVANAAVIERPNGNMLVDLGLVEKESGARVRMRPLWIAGPKEDEGPLAVQNRLLIAQLLTLAGEETSGKPGELIPKLIGMEFAARLTCSQDAQTGVRYNAIAEVFADEAA